MRLPGTVVLDKGPGGGVMGNIIRGWAALRNYDGTLTSSIRRTDFGMVLRSRFGMRRSN